MAAEQKIQRKGKDDDSGTQREATFRERPAEWKQEGDN